jgi:predicted regulator of amino acid metabolism with ACT domain
MIKFGQFPFSDESKSIINKAVAHHLHASGIEISGYPESDSEGIEVLKVSIAQKAIPERKMFSRAELHDLAYDIFFADSSISPVGQKLDISVVG